MEQAKIAIGRSGSVLGLAGLAFLVSFSAWASDPIDPTSEAQSRIARRYQSHYDDYLSCRSQMQNFDPESSARLAESEATRLMVLQLQDNPIAYDATLLLSMYAKHDPALRERLTTRIDKLLTSGNPHGQRSGVLMARWFGASGHGEQLRELQDELAAKANLSVHERSLLASLRNLELQGAF